MRFFLIFFLVLGSCSIAKKDFLEKKPKEFTSISKFNFLDKNKNGVIEANEFKVEKTETEKKQPLYVFLYIIGIVFLIMLVPTLQYFTEKIFDGYRKKKSL
jgi:hypothetical protein